MGEANVEVQIARLSGQVESLAAMTTRGFTDSARVMDRIETQVRATNGRVTHLEAWKHEVVAVAQYDRDVRTRPDGQVLTIGWVNLFVKYGGWVVAGMAAWKAFRP